MVELSRSLAHYFLNRLPEDDVCHWDLALLGTDAVRDSSAAAITACGLLELVNARRRSISIARITRRWRCVSSSR